MAAYAHKNSKGLTYYLHAKAITLRDGRNQTIFFFAKTEGGKGHPVDLPTGYEVTENSRNGFLTIRKSPFYVGPWNSDELLPGVFPVNPFNEVAIAESSLGTTDPAGNEYEVLLPQPVFASSFSAIVRALGMMMDDPEVPEREFQDLFEQNPELLLGDSYLRAVPQVVLEPGEGVFKPDFMLRPVEHDLWDILELKRPTVPLLAGRGRHVRPHHELTMALGQVRDYAVALEDPAVRTRLEDRYHIRAFRPRLMLLIGRTNDLDRLDLRRATDSLTRDVELLSWDDQLARLQRRLRRCGSG